MYTLDKVIDHYGYSYFKNSAFCEPIKTHILQFVYLPLEAAKALPAYSLPKLSKV